ncbi:hypothetical protein D3C83_231740 [compost metagenome]
MQVASRQVDRLLATCTGRLAQCHDLWASLAAGFTDVDGVERQRHDDVIESVVDDLAVIITG